MYKTRLAMMCLIGLHATSGRADSYDSDKSLAGLHGRYHLELVDPHAGFRKPDGSEYPPCPGKEPQSLLRRWEPLTVTVDSGLAVDDEEWQIDHVYPETVTAHSKKDGRFRIQVGANAATGAESRIVAILSVVEVIGGRECAASHGFMEK
jgi:hypothetical protein